jgi:prepilin-type processing-associated H-X9-DG protein
MHPSAGRWGWDVKRDTANALIGNSGNIDIHSYNFGMGMTDLPHFGHLQSNKPADGNILFLDSHASCAGSACSALGTKPTIARLWF